MIYRKAPTNPLPHAFAQPQPANATESVASTPTPNSALNTRPSARIPRRPAAEYLGVSLSWLDKSRMTGTGPAYIEIGGRVIYDTGDLDAYMAARRRSKVSD